jgi:hypothetical protein
MLASIALKVFLGVLWLLDCPGFTSTYGLLSDIPSKNWLFTAIGSTEGADRKIAVLGIF